MLLKARQKEKGNAYFITYFFINWAWSCQMLKPQKFHFTHAHVVGWPKQNRNRCSENIYIFSVNWSTVCVRLGPTLEQLHFKEPYSIYFGKLQKQKCFCFFEFVNTPCTRFRALSGLSQNMCFWIGAEDNGNTFLQLRFSTDNAVIRVFSYDWVHL